MEFLHPGYMVAGGALVSAPIIIHLINRMRFRRVRWAAMEFLLKSQKRNRRRLIIEQMILLALRCLLVLLAGLLVARYIYGSTAGNSGTMHLVVIDDSLSMADRHRDSRGQDLTAFDVARLQVQEMARQAAQANAVQKMRVVLLSDLGTAVFDEKLDNQSLEKLKNKLDDLRPTALHLEPLAAVEKGKEYFADSKDSGQRVLHLASDFRDADWGTGPGVEKLTEAVDRLLDAGVNLSLIDTAHPYRSETKGVAIDHGNVAVLDLRAEARMAAVGVPVEFAVKIANYGSSEKKPFVKVRVNGDEDFGASHPLEKPIAPGETVEHKFQVTFAKRRPAAEVRDADKGDERERKRLADREFAQVSVELDGEDGGLRADNVRDLVLEVRNRVPTLVVDGSGPDGRLPGGDEFHIETALGAARAYEVERRTVEELEKTNLDLYPSVFLLNVPKLSEAAVAKLARYVEGGGSVAWFVGDRVQAAFYNETLFRKNKALFPVLLTGRPTEAPSPEEQEARRRDGQQKILFRQKPDPQDPAAAVTQVLYEYRTVFTYLDLDRYWPAQPRVQWDPTGKETQELIVLPNRRSVDDYKARAQELLKEASEKTHALAAENNAFAKYERAVDEHHRRAVAQALGTPYLFQLVKALDDLLLDPGSDKDPLRPDMPQLWSQAKMAALKSQLEAFRDTVLYGDPLLVYRPHGRGKVVACLTPAGTASGWNKWGGGCPASWTYLVFLMDLQRFLTGQGGDLNRLVGEEVTFPLDATRYQNKVQASLLPQPDPDTGDGTAKPGEKPAARELGTSAMENKDTVLTFVFNQSRRPGVYTFNFFPVQAGASEPPPEPRPYAFNVDSVREGNLKRAPRERLERVRANSGDPKAAKITLRSPGDSYEAFKNRQPDASESPWLYLLFLLVLVVEQALAVHLSFHLKGNEAAPPAAAGGPRTQPAAA
jgi:hypothetical protein